MRSRVSWLLLSLALGGCRESDEARTHQTLEFAGFSKIQNGTLIKGNDFSCPTNYLICTRFIAMAPWHVLERGVVVCPAIGTCDIHVIIDEPNFRYKLMNVQQDGGVHGSD